MIGNPIFIAGTDTDAGKTFAASALLHAAKERRMTSYGLKPIAAGAVSDQHGSLKNNDALELMKASSESLPYDQVNPIVLEPAIAPHIALEKAKRQTNVSELAAHCRKAIENYPADFVLIEGAGGWFVPLNMYETLADLCIELNVRVVLVVGMKLGCISHALLTVQAIADAGLELCAWIANSPIEPMPYLTENIDTLRRRIVAPCIGEIPPLTKPEEATRYLDISSLV